MTTITILNADGSLFRKVLCYDAESASVWLTQFQTQSEWTAGMTYTTQDSPEVEPSDTDVVKAKRTALMNSTRWIWERHHDEIEMGIPTSITDATYQQWLQYWQSLRDLPDQEGFDPENPVWPDQPPVKG